MTLPPALTSLFKKVSVGTPKHDPVRDWLVLLVLALLWLVASVLWNGWFLLSVVAEGPSTPAPTTTAPVESAYDKARTVYDARAVEAGHYQTDYRFNDPAK
jgi:hypothetical protein